MTDPGSMGMVAEAFQSNLSGFCSREVFKPFVVELVSGARHTVEHSGALNITKKAAMLVAPAGDFVMFDDEGVAQVHGIETAPAAPSKQAG